MVYPSSTTLQVNENKRFTAKKNMDEFHMLSIKCHIQKVYNVQFHIPKVQNQVKLFYDVGRQDSNDWKWEKEGFWKASNVLLILMQVAQELFTV